MSDVDRGQVSTSAAEVYEELFLPALFAQFAPVVCDAAMIDEGQRVVDVACGTGAVARVAAERVGPSGSVVGVDVNPGMLAVARRIRPDLDWREGEAEALPLDDGSVDAAVSQFGLMFFDDRESAIGEMRRVVRSGGRVAVAVWAGLDRSPGYAEAVEILRDLFGDGAARSLETPFLLGDPSTFGDVLERGGLRDAAIEVRPGRARFGSIREWMLTDVRGWTLADSLSDEQFELLVEVAERRQGRFVQADGSVGFAAPALVATASV